MKSAVVRRRRKRKKKRWKEEKEEKQEKKNEHLQKHRVVQRKTRETPINIKTHRTA